MDALICGAPTWRHGRRRAGRGTAWDEFLYDRLPSLDLSGAKVAIFGLGDQGSYGDNFCDAAGGSTTASRPRAPPWSASRRRTTTTIRTPRRSFESIVGLRPLCDEDMRDRLDERGPRQRLGRAAEGEAVAF